MESFTRDNLQVHCELPHIPWDDENIQKEEDLCMSYTGDASIACWQEISHMYNSAFENDPEAVFEACQKAPTDEAKYSCYRHAVNTLVQKDNPDSDYFASICAPVANDQSQYEGCVKNVVYSLIYSSYKFADRVMDFCKSLEPGQQQFCFSNSARALFNILPVDRRGDICQILPREYQNICLGN